MRVVVETPDAPIVKAAPADTSLQRQLAAFQAQLITLLKSQQQHTNLRAEVLDAVNSRQDQLLAALEKLFRAFQAQSAKPTTDHSAAALQGLKQVIADLPDALKSSLSRPVSTPKSMTVTAQLPGGFMDRMDALEGAILAAGKTARGRTFGSNY